MYKITTTGALFSAVGAASAAMPDMVAGATPGKLYLLTVSTATFFKQGASAPTATAGNDSVLVTPNYPLLVDPGNGLKSAVIQAAAGGFAVLTPVSIVR